MLLEPLITSGYAKAYPLYGEALEAEGEFKAAVSIWTEAKDVRSLRGAASRAAKEERYEEALLAYEAAYRIEPEAGAKSLAHLLWFFLEQEEQAEELLRQTLATFPDSPHRIELWHELGWLYHKQERWDAAEEVYEQILALEASDWHSHISLGWLYYERDHDVEKARTHFQRAIALNPTPANGYFALAQLLNREGAYSEADQWYQQALERSPKTYYWYILRANNAQSAGDMTLALAIYEELISRFPDSPQAYMRAAELYEASNQIERAIETYQQLLELEPNHEAAKQGIERLERLTGER
jgi:tetratricopeptide (TPR) repeat protein